MSPQEKQDIIDYVNRLDGMDRRQVEEGLRRLDELLAAFPDDQSAKDASHILARQLEGIEYTESSRGLI